MHEVIEIAFDQGNPVAVNGQALSPAALLRELNRLGGRNGIGRADIVENRFVGMKSRGVYETPGGTILRAAHMAMESITLDREVMHLRIPRFPTCVEMVYGHSPAPEACCRTWFMEMTADVRWCGGGLNFNKGNCRVLGRKSDRSLYSIDLQPLKCIVYRQKDAEGFIRLNALR